MARLLTETMKKNLSSKYPLYSQDGKGRNAKCICKFFFGSYTWYITEMSFEGNDLIMYGITKNQYGCEYGYISYNEISQVKYWGIPCVERDRYFGQPLLKDIKDTELQNFLAV